MTAIFDLPPTLTWESIYTNPDVFLDPENVGVAVGIVLLSCVLASTYVITYSLPVIGGHLWFTTNPDVREYSYTSSSMLQKCWIAVEVCCYLMC